MNIFYHHRLSDDLISVRSSFHVHEIVVMKQTGFLGFGLLSDE